MLYPSHLYVIIVSLGLILMFFSVICCLRSVIALMPVAFSKSLSLASFLSMIAACSSIACSVSSVVPGAVIMFRCISLISSSCVIVTAVLMPFLACSSVFSYPLTR